TKRASSHTKGPALPAAVSTHTITLTAAGSAGPFVWELARFVVGWNELFTLERLATYLRLTDAQGAVVFITNQGSDPFAVLQVGGTVLRVRWILDVSRTDNTAGAFLLAAPPAFLPLGGPLGGIPRQWRDLRYSWGQRSQEGHQGTVTGPAQVRFFVELETVGDEDRKSTRLNSSHVKSSYAVFCLENKMRTVRTPAMTA